jgi:cytochrome P450
MISALVLHLDPEMFPNPDDFDPSESPTNQMRNSFTPFGGGTEAIETQGP